MNEKLKMYVPDGSLEKFVWGLLEGAGFETEKPDRGYDIRTNSKLWDFKQIRPQDQPYQTAKGNAELCIVGEDILKEFQLSYPGLNDNIEIVQSFEGRPTKLVAVVLDEKYQTVGSLKEFFETAGNDIPIAAEYPKIAKDYISKNCGLEVDVYKPAGKTEATLTGNRPEMELIIDTTETGNTIRANGGKIIETLMESKQVAVVNSGAYGTPSSKSEIDNLLEQFNGVMRSKLNTLKKLQVNVLDGDNAEKIIDYLMDEGYRPTVSKLYPEGSDIYVVLPNSKIKNISPKLNAFGGSDMIVTSVERLIYPKKR